MGLSKKAIGLLHYTAPPVVGGVESVMAHHARLLAEAGHAVCMIAARGDTHIPNVEFKKIPLVDSRDPEIMGMKGHLDRGEVPPNFAVLVDRIAVELQTAVSHLDYLIAHNICSLHKNLALTAALRQVCQQPDAPHLIIWHHDLACATPRYADEVYPGYPWDLIRQDWPDVQPTHVVVSQLRRRELAELFQMPPETIHVIPSGLEIDNFLKLEPQTVDLLEQTNYLQASPRLLLPVRITRRKNIELAIKTVAAMCQHMPQTSLIITGPPGPHNPSNQVYFDDLRQLRAELGVQGQVHFMAEIVEAYLPDVVIADFFRVADALLFPSREEGFGIPALEAGLVRMPIFCADILPLREIAGSHATYFSPDIDPATLAKLITDQLQNSDVYQLRQQVLQQYTWGGIYEHRIAPLLNYQQKKIDKRIPENSPIDTIENNRDVIHKSPE